MIKFLISYVDVIAFEWVHVHGLVRGEVWVHILH